MSPKHPIICGIVSQTTDVLHKLDIARFHSFPNLSHKKQVSCSRNCFCIQVAAVIAARSELQVPLMYFQLQASVLSHITLNFYFFYSA